LFVFFLVMCFFYIFLIFAYPMCMH
jgi:hypothetical protein